MNEGSDIVRSFLVIVPGFIILGIAATVMKQYWPHYKSNVWKRGTPMWRKGYHVWLIAISYSLLVFDITASAIERFGQPGTWHLYVRFVALAIGGAALALFVRTERGRAEDRRKKPEPAEPLPKD